MADYTENLNLKKPARTDYFSVADFNGNADIIDTAVGDIDAALDGKLNTDFSNISGGAIPISNGGTGATTASDAITNLGVDTALSDKADKDLSNVTGTLPITKGGTGATTTANALSNLGVTTALSDKADKNLSNVTGTLAIANGGTGATTAADALSNLGVTTALNNKADKDLSNVTGTLAIANGGTGATTAANALSNLGITTALSDKADKDLSNITGTLAIANGGTGATTAANALTNLGIDTALNNKADKDLSNVTGTLAIANGGTGNTTGYVTAGASSSSTIGNRATCEGNSTVASGAFSHAEGRASRATGDYSHAEGGGTNFSWYTVASGQSSHAEGELTKANARASHAEGLETTSSGVGSHSEGSLTKASGNYSHAEGEYPTASGDSSHAEGEHTTASAIASHAEGYYTKAKGYYSHAAGYYTTANCYQTVVGSYNVEKGSTSTYTSGSGYLIVGCGTGSSATANCFRATESNTYGLTYNSSGADYAEMFEWKDGNKKNEDRIGKFVTLDGDKIKLATDQDDYILGVVSGNPSIIGDSHDDQWVGMFEKDMYGRPVYEKVTIPEEKDEEGNIISPETINDQLKVSDKYKNDEEYIPRSQRPEWTAVGLLGKLICIDDETAEINGYVRPNENSIATHSEEKTKYRVMKRIDETHIQIIIL